MVGAVPGYVAADHEQICAISRWKPISRRTAARAAFFGGDMLTGDAVLLNLTVECQ
jgi:hypothetical protein